MDGSSRLSRRGSANRRRGVAADEVRRHNLAAVLDRLHLSGSVSRSELAERTGLNRSTIGDLISELSDLGLVEEGPGEANSKPGRPSPVARPRPEGAVALAVEITVDSVAVSTAGLGGRIYNEVRVARPRARFTPQETIEDVAKLAAPLLASLPDKHNLAGVGFAVAGLVRRSDGFVHLAPNLGWRNVPLGAMAATALGLDRVMMANEADLGALGEYRRGAGSTVGHLIYVAGEVGIGIGIIQNGAPMLGSAGYAGEAGHTMVNPGGRRCRCGASGCWETEAGEEALARLAGMPEGIVGQALLDELMTRADQGDTNTLRALDDVGRWLGLGIGNLINTLNPDMVVVGGIYSDLFPHMEEAVRKGTAESALEAPAGMADIRRGELGLSAPLIGAAELVLSELIANPAAFSGVEPSIGKEAEKGGGPDSSAPLVSEDLS